MNKKIGEKKLLNKNRILTQINTIRKEIGHDNVNIHIKETHYDEKTKELWIIAEDRPDKSAIIGKGGWVVGKLKEKLKLTSIHVESYEDYLLKNYKLKLSQKSIKQTNETLKLNGLENLRKTITSRINNPYTFNIEKYLKENKFDESNKITAIVALSGGVDSSFSLILAKKLGFNPIAITVDPGTIILPNQYKKNIKQLTDQLEVKHEYLTTDYSEIIKESLKGKLHPCGRCSKNTGETIKNYAQKNKIPIIIYGDMLATGTQCINKQNNTYRLNLPASLSTGKQEIKSLIRKYNLKEFKGFGCPLLYEVHKKYPYLKKYSIQRILRETRSSALEPGEALDLIWSFYRL